MTGGCEGGLAHYHGFFTEHGHLTSEECAPYKNKSPPDQCKNYRKCPKLARVKKTYHVGGNYHVKVEQEQI